MKFHKIVLMLIIWPMASNAHPVAYKDALAIMTWSNSHSKDIWAAYSIEPHWSIGGRYIKMTENNADLELYLPQVSLLIKRWNELKTQSNFYVYGGYGYFNSNNGSGGVPSLGLEADSESRKLYVLGRIESIWPDSKVTQTSYEFRVGAAPYESEYDEVGAWFIIQNKYNKQISKNIEVTPLIRIYYRSFLTEMGISLKGDPNINLMFHF